MSPRAMKNKAPPLCQSPQEYNPPSLPPARAPVTAALRYSAAAWGAPPVGGFSALIAKAGNNELHEGHGDILVHYSALAV
jgi:hypothetical protein